MSNLQERNCADIIISKLTFFAYTGHELSHAQQYGIAAGFSFPLFFIAGAGAAVFWVLGEIIFLKHPFLMINFLNLYIEV